jgi:hypothetical protein
MDAIVRALYIFRTFGGLFLAFIICLRFAALVVGTNATPWDQFSYSLYPIGSVLGLGVLFGVVGAMMIKPMWTLREWDKRKQAFVSEMKTGIAVGTILMFSFGMTMRDGYCPACSDIIKGLGDHLVSWFAMPAKVL